MLSASCEINTYKGTFRRERERQRQRRCCTHIILGHALVQPAQIPIVFRRLHVHLPECVQRQPQRRLVQLLRLEQQPMMGRPPIVLAHLLQHRHLLQRNLLQYQRLHPLRGRQKQMRRRHHTAQDANGLLHVRQRAQKMPRTVVVHVQRVGQVLLGNGHRQTALTEQRHANLQCLLVGLNALVDRIDVQQIERAVHQRIGVLVVAYAKVAARNLQCLCEISKYVTRSQFIRFQCRPNASHTCTRSMRARPKCRFRTHALAVWRSTSTVSLAGVLAVSSRTAAMPQRLLLS